MHRTLTPEESMHYEHCEKCACAVEERILEELVAAHCHEPCVLYLDTGAILCTMTPLSTSAYVVN